MKPFNLEEAKAGKPVCTRNGCKTRILSYDRKDGRYPIIALVEDSKGNEDAFGYTLRGECEYSEGQDNELDLMMAGEKKEGWVNIYRQDNKRQTGVNVYKLKEEALVYSSHSDYIATVKIEWEE